MNTSTLIGRMPGMHGAQNLAARLCLTLLATLAFSTVQAQGDEQSGKEVVDSVCATCHATGADGAPKIGDTEAWSQLSSMGLSSLTLNAVQGIRNMPAHGGNAELSDLEIARAVAYMVNQSGGDWVEPLSVAMLAEERSGKGVVNAHCSECHAEGVGGAPKIGDLEDWLPRIKQGLPYLVSSAIHGHGGMPPRGGRADLTDAELYSAILYMYNPAGAPTKPASRAASAATESNHQTVGGINVYLGFIQAENLRALPNDSPERAMHGGIPEGQDYYHVNVTLRDEDSRAPIDDAQVQIQLARPGWTSSPTELERLPYGGSYGNYVKPRPGEKHLITLYVHRSGEARTVEAKFERMFE